MKQYIPIAAAVGAFGAVTALGYYAGRYFGHHRIGASIGAIGGLVVANMVGESLTSYTSVRAMSDGTPLTEVQEKRYDDAQKRVSAPNTTSVFVNSIMRGVAAPIEVMTEAGGVRASVINDESPTPRRAN